jgi:putative transcriptional regulator
MRKELFAELVESVKEMQEIRRGRRPASRVTRVADVLRTGVPDVASLRARFGLSQAKFAALLGISVDTLQNWEQGRRQPEGPARVLLRIAVSHPEALLELARPPRKQRNGRSAA